VPEAPVAVAPAPAPDFSWTGIYAGVSVAGGRVNDSFSEFDTSGVGVQVGYLRDLGTLVFGGELSYSAGDFGDELSASEWTATRLKLIGGYKVGRFLPYAFVGLTSYDIDQALPYSDNMTNFGIGARYAFGARGKVVVGLEYLSERKDDFDDAGFDLSNDEVSLRLDYRF
jgi:hypothetical protein